MANPKPVVIMGSVPVVGHSLPPLSIARALTSLSYPVYYLAGTLFESKVLATGATFIPLTGAADLTVPALEAFPERFAMPPGLEQINYDMIHMFLKPIPTQYRILQETILRVQEEHPGREVVVIGDNFFYGTTPLMYGAPGPKPMGIIHVGVCPMTLSSPFIPPFGPGLPYDISPDGLGRNAFVQSQIRREFAGAQKTFQDVLEATGAQRPEQFFLDAITLKADFFIQLGPEGLEYPRPDAPAGLRFSGSAPVHKEPEWVERPSWWADVVFAEAQGKKVVFVAQGTIQLDYRELILPTLSALSSNPDLLVVAALGEKGATIEFPAGGLDALPENARVLDYIPYTQILPFTDLMVGNGGYGSALICARFGVPIVVAGMTEDKAEVGARVAFGGWGLNLRTQKPTDEQIAEAVQNVLGNAVYREKAQGMKKEIEGVSPVGVVEECIRAIVEKNEEAKRGEEVAEVKDEMQVSVAEAVEVEA